MKRLITNLVIKLWGSYFIQLLSRNIHRHSLTIILCHEITPEKLDENIKYLKKQFEFISLPEVRDFYKNNGEIPAKSCWLTLDDGLMSNFELLPVFVKHNIRPTIFLAAGLVGTHKWIWTYRAKEKKNKFYDIDFSKISNQEKNNILKERIDYSIDKEYSERQLLSWDEVREMSEYVDFQSHTMTHAILTQCSDSELVWELRQSKHVLEGRLKEDVFAIAYPNGVHDERVINAAKEAGYEIGREARVQGVNHKYTNPLKLTRITIGPNDTPRDSDKQIKIAEIKTVLSRIGLNV